MTEQVNKLPQKHALPTDLLEYDQWVAWHREDRNGKPTKVPYSPCTGGLAAVDDSTTWATFDVAYAYCLTAHRDGLGFVFTANDPFVGIDLDKCRDPQTGKIEDWALEIIKKLDSFTEVSPSGTGIHILIKGKLPKGQRRSGRIEMYGDGRYFTVTGHHLDGTPMTIQERQEELSALHAQTFGKPLSNSNGKVKVEQPQLRDVELIEIAKSAANGEKFSKLWAGEWQGEYNSASDADQALCNLLAFWTGRDPTRIDRLFRQSGLMRDKWDEKHYADGRTYGQATIDSAIGCCKQTYTPAEHLYLVRTSDEEQTDSSEVPPVHATEALAIASRYLILECLAEEEYGDARLLASLYQDRLVYDHGHKCWFYWAGQWWQRDRTALVRKLVAGQLAAQYLHLAAEIAKEAAACADPKGSEAQEKRATAERLTARAFSLRRLNRVDNILVFAASLLGITGDEWDSDGWLLGVKNGIVDLKTGIHRTGRPHDYIRTVAPTEWKGLNEPAPRWQKFIEEILERDSHEETTRLASFFQRLLGYGLVGKVIEHKLPVCHGAGRNGKDTLFETIAHVLGDAAGPVSGDVLIAKKREGGTAEPHLCDLQGKRIVWVSETNEGAKINTGQAKLITGGGKIKTRPLYGQMIEFDPTHLLFLITNVKPHAPAEDYALWERLILIPFNYSFVDNPKKSNERRAEKHLRETLAGEASGILAWMVRGCLNWQAEGLNPPECVLAATEKYREEEDTLSLFIEECCTLGPEATVSGQRLYATYDAWSGKKGMSNTTFGKRMSERFEKKHTNRGVIYCGVSLISESQDTSFPNKHSESEKERERIVTGDGCEGESRKFSHVSGDDMENNRKTRHTRHPVTIGNESPPNFVEKPPNGRFLPQIQKGDWINLIDSHGVLQFAESFQVVDIKHGDDQERYCEILDGAKQRYWPERGAELLCPNCRKPTVHIGEVPVKGALRFWCRNSGCAPFWREVKVTHEVEN